jgi:hypothetical protein
MKTLLMNIFVLVIMIFSKFVFAAGIDNNIALNAIRQANNGNDSVIYLEDGIVDIFKDDSGINSTLSSNLSFGSGAALILHLDGADGVMTSTNAGTSPARPLFNSDVELDTAAYKFGSASAKFGGTRYDYITMPDNPDWDIGTSSSDDWTIDLWVKHADHTGTEIYITQFQDGNNFWNLRHEHGNGLKFWWHSTQAGTKEVNTGFGGEISDADWHHIALCKVGSKYAIYKDGAQVAYVDDVDTHPSFNGVLYLGSNTSASAFSGHLDEVRIHKGNYFNADPNVGQTDTIMVPTSAVSLDLSQIPLALSFEGVDAATTATNDGTNTGAITFNTNAQIDTAYSYSGSSSVLFDGNRYSYLSIPDSSDWDLAVSSASVWTVEFWIRNPGGYDQNEYYVGQSQDGNNYWKVYDKYSEGLSFSLAANGSVVAQTPPAGEITDSNWHHIALCKVGADYGLYKDGVQVGFTNHTNNYSSFSGDLFIGNATAANTSFSGSMDELRIHKTNFFNAKPKANLSDSFEIIGPTDGISNFSSVSPTFGQNMTIVSDVFDAESVPSTIKILLLANPFQSISLNTDLTAQVSRNGGISWETATLSKVGYYEPGKEILVGSAGVTGQSSGTDIMYQITTDNGVNLKLDGIAVSWE